jgi:hypothetical protein
MAREVDRSRVSRGRFRHHRRNANKGVRVRALAAVIVRPSRAIAVSGKRSPDHRLTGIPMLRGNRAVAYVVAYAIH